MTKLKEYLFSLFEKTDPKKFVWKTIKGTHVLLGKDGKIKAGADGKFNGEKIDNVGKRETKESRIEYGHAVAKITKISKKAKDVLFSYSSMANTTINHCLRSKEEFPNKRYNGYVEEMERCLIDQEQPKN